MEKLKPVRQFVGFFVLFFISQQQFLMQNFSKPLNLAFNRIGDWKQKMRKWKTLIESYLNMSRKLY